MLSCLNLLKFVQKYKKLWDIILMKKVDFLVCGAQKAGTTALFDYLKGVPDIFIPTIKELHFFDNEEFYSGFLGLPPFFLGFPPLSLIVAKKYHKYFKKGDRKKIWGEMTPIYMYWNNCFERIKKYNSEMKIIMLLRNPVKRAYSQWNMEVRNKFEDLGFIEALQKEIDELEAFGGAYQSRHTSYISRGLYVSQVQRAMEIFPHKNVKIIKYEDYNDNQFNVIEDICNFLGVKDFEHPVEKITSNKLEYKKNITEAEFDFSFPFFADDIDRLEKLLSWDCSDWKKYT